MSLSHMSLIVQPAPLIITAPAPKRASIPRSGKQPGIAPLAMPHPHGQNSSQDPKILLIHQK